MTGNFTWLSALCAPEAALRGSLLVGLFVAGTAGSVVHCAPMCGGFVLGQVCERMTRLTPEKLSETRRIGNSLLLPYHSGRLTTYAMLGAAAATAAGWFA